MQSLINEELKSLLNKAFDKSNYIANFPQVFNNANVKNLIYYPSEDKLQSFCAMYPYFWHYKNEFLRGMCIGSVATPAEFRGKGLALHVLTKAELHAKSLGYDFLVLFSDLEDLYTKAGYTKALPDKLVYFSSENSAASSNFSRFKQKISQLIAMNYERTRAVTIVETPSELTCSQKAELWRFLVLNQNRGENILSYLDFCDLLTIPNMYLIKVEKENELAGIVFWNKGDDFPQVFHTFSCKETMDLFWMIHIFIQKNQVASFGVFLEPWAEKFNKYNLIPEKVCSLYVKSIQKNNYTTADLSKIFNRHLFVTALQSS